METWLNIDDVKRDYPLAYAALCAEEIVGWVSFDEMYEDVDLCFSLRDGELYIESRDEQTRSVWRDDSWQDVPFD